MIKFHENYFIIGSPHLQDYITIDNYQFIEYNNEK